MQAYIAGPSGDKPLSNMSTLSSKWTGFSINNEQSFNHISEEPSSLRDQQVLYEFVKKK